MQIQVDTDRTVEGRQALTATVEAEVRSALGRFEERLTRVEVHLGREAAEEKRGGPDSRCLMEARPVGLQPVTTTASADSLEVACREAARKMQDLLSTRFGRIDDRDANATIRQEEGG